MKTPETEITYDIICDRMPEPQTHFSTYELAMKWGKEMSLAFNEPVYIVQRTTTYEICHVIGKKKARRRDENNN